MPVPAQCRVQEEGGTGLEQDPSWTRHFVDDSIWMEVQDEMDGGGDTIGVDDRFTISAT